MKCKCFESNLLHFENKNTTLSKFHKPYSMYWEIYLNETKELIGSIDARSDTKDFKECEIGYSIAPPFRKKGYGYDSVKSMVSYLFSIENTDCITAKYYANNIGSQKILEKNGFIILSSKNNIVTVQLHHATAKL